MSMDPMPAPAHAKPVPRRDHLWVLAVIAFCCLIKVWPSWVGIGAEAGFPKLGRMATDWTLAVVIEAYWAYAVWAALVPAGRRSRLFAAWSAAGVFVLSLVGQSTASVMTVTAVKVFANALPVVVLALIAILVHLRHVDREEAAEAEADAAAAREAAALRAELDAEREALQPLRDALTEAEKRASEALTQAEIATRKLAAKSAQAKRSKTAPRGGKNAQADDLTNEWRAFQEMEKDPSLRGPRKGAELARKLKVAPATGRRLHAKLTAQGQPGESLTESLTERSADQPDERSPDRS